MLTAENYRWFSLGPYAYWPSGILPFFFRRLIFLERGVAKITHIDWARKLPVQY